MTPYIAAVHARALSLAMALAAALAEGKLSPRLLCLWLPGRRAVQPLRRLPGVLVATRTAKLGITTDLALPRFTAAAVGGPLLCSSFPSTLSPCSGSCLNECTIYPPVVTWRLPTLAVWSLRNRRLLPSACLSSHLSMNGCVCLGVCDVP